MIIPKLRIRVTNIDATVVKSIDKSLDDTTLPCLPVIRVFGHVDGSDGSSKYNACVHIHQVYPYLYIEYTGSKEPQAVHAYIRNLRNALNEALGNSKKSSELARSEWRYIRHILFVKGVPFYGFHHNYHAYLKILLADPHLLQTAATILRSGAIFNYRFAVYEAHIGYTLQFMIDFNLYGCGWLEIRDAWIRGDAEDSGIDGFNLSQFPVSPLSKSTRSNLEFDIQAYQILNRHLMTARSVSPILKIPPFPLSASAPMPTSTPEPLVHSIRELWDAERARRASLGLDPSPPMPVEATISQRGSGREGRWEGSGYHDEELQERIEAEKGQWQPKRTLELWERLAWTTLESTEMLWEPQWRTIRKEPEDDQLVPDPKQEPSNLPHPDGQPVGSQESSHNPFESSTDTGEDEALSHKGQKFPYNVDLAILSSQGVSAAIDQENAFEQDHVLTPFQGESSGRSKTSQKPIAGSPTVSECSPQGPKGTTTPRPLRVLATPRSGSVAPKRWRTQDLFSQTAQVPPPRFTPDRNGDGHSNDKSGVHFARDTLGLAKLVKSSQNERDIDPQNVLTNSGETKTSKDSSPLDFSGTHRVDEDRWREPKRQRVTGISFLSDPLSPTSPSSYSEKIAPSFSQGPSAFEYSRPPPSAPSLLETLSGAYGLPARLFQDPFYSNPADQPTRPVEVAGIQVYIPGPGIRSLPDWDLNWEGGQGGEFSVHRSPQRPRLRMRTSSDDYAASRLVHGWTYSDEPPGRAEIRKWLKEISATPGWNKLGISRKAALRSQITGPTQATQLLPPNRKQDPVRRAQSMSMMALEILACCDEDRNPDPERDALTAVFYSFQSNLTAPIEGELRRESYVTGIMAVDNGKTGISKDMKYAGLRGVIVVDDELSLFNTLEKLVLDLDPDALTSFELQHGGWGYVGARYKHEFGGDLSYGSLISRILEGHERVYGWAGWEAGQEASFVSTGRHVLNLWGIFRKEYTYTSYTFENNVCQLLGRRIPRYPNVLMSQWMQSTFPADVFRVLAHLEDRVKTVMDLVNESDLITKTSEFARVFGVDFMSVITRGSQLKVEAFMFRLAKQESFVLVSPSREDVGLQNAAECIPMIMEPRSAFYKSPLVVLDFQALYPSIMIAYNYCYSTCLGRIATFPKVDGKYKLGWREVNQQPGIFEQLKNYIHIAPNGIAYTKPTVRKSLLAKMLEEVLETRVMVKQAMKTAKPNKALLRVLDARQLGLKYIANVTYGYTSASFSGRMPCVEIADSIVEAGRQTLESAIQMIDNTPAWGGRVVYGDTDSIFISLPGKTKEEAFRIGQDIADNVTLAHPSPIKLKFEKVYFPCVLESKKRYVGFKYESLDDTTPTFDAKGIETVRRDGVRAQSKMLEVSLKILFRTQDLSQVKEYCIQEWNKILGGKVTVEDFVFAKEVRLGTYSEKGNPQAHAVVGALLEAEDRGSYIYGDRVPHAIARREPGSRLAETAHHVKEFLWQDGDGRRPLYIDERYYIEHILIPPLARVFDHVGADVRVWYKMMPKIRRADPATSYERTDTVAGGSLKPTRGKGARYGIDAHFRKAGCVSCGKPAEDTPFCRACLAVRPITLLSLLSRLRDAEAKALDTQRVCASCTGAGPLAEIGCESYDCTWLFERHKAGNEVRQMRGAWNVASDLKW